MSEKGRKLVSELEKAGISIKDVISDCFLGYKYRKYNCSLYESDAEVPTRLIRLYYGLNPEIIPFDKMKDSFVEHYVRNENMLEGSYDEREIEGFKKMYEYIHSDDINYLFDVYTLKDLHMFLFSTAEHPQYAGNFRNWDVYLPGAGAELCEWSMIHDRLDELNPEILALRSISQQVCESGDVNQLLDYLDRCVVLKCKLIKVHPFGDGNGRTIRGFINKLLEDVNLPPIYIKGSEKLEYIKAMQKAVNEENYKYIKGFYRYKICDSIIELDINNLTRKPVVYEKKDNK